jgi:hypothetical protein
MKDWEKRQAGNEDDRRRRKAKRKPEGFLKSPKDQVK